MEVAFSGWLCQQAVEPQSFCPHFGWRENFQNHGFFPSFPTKTRQRWHPMICILSWCNHVYTIKNSFSLHRGPSKNGSAGCWFDHVSWVISSSRTVLLCIYLLHTCPMSSKMWSLHAPRCGSPKWKSPVFREFFFGQLRVSHGFSQQKAKFSGFPMVFPNKQLAFPHGFPRGQPPQEFRLRCQHLYHGAAAEHGSPYGTFPAFQLHVWNIEKPYRETMGNPMGHMGT